MVNFNFFFGDIDFFGDFFSFFPGDFFRGEFFPGDFFRGDFFPGDFFRGDFFDFLHDKYAPLIDSHMLSLGGGLVWCLERPHLFVDPLYLHGEFGDIKESFPFI